MNEQKKPKSDEKHSAPMKDKNAELKPKQDVELERDKKSKTGKPAEHAKP